MLHILCLSDSDGCFLRSHLPWIGNCCAALDLQDYVSLSCTFRPEALQYMGTNRIYVTESVEWPGRPIVKLKNLTIVRRKDGDITVDGKWLLEKEPSGSFENITFKNGQDHCHCLSHVSALWPSGVSQLSFWQGPQRACNLKALDGTFSIAISGLQGLLCCYFDI